MSRWPQRSWWIPSACRRRRRAEFCRRRLKAGAAERATRLAVRRGFQGHRGRPRGLQSWPGGGWRRPWRACGRRASFLNIHVPMTHATSLFVHCSQASCPSVRYMLGITALFEQPDPLRTQCATASISQTLHVQTRAPCNTQALWVQEQRNARTPVTTQALW